MNGRDHNHYGFTMWLAGGGVKGGYVHGATDDLGFQAVDKKVHVHDLHATMLYLLGFDHEQLHVSLRRQRLPPDRRARNGRERHHRLKSQTRDFGRDRGQIPAFLRLIAAATTKNRSPHAI